MKFRFGFFLHLFLIYSRLFHLAYATANNLDDLEVCYNVDSSGVSIGRKYARADEIAVPFGITIDFDTVKFEPYTVTLRERDTMEQLRIPVAEVSYVVSRLSTGRTTWLEVAKDFPRFEQQATKE